MGVLLTLVNLLLKLLRLFLICEAQTRHAILQLEAVKECPVLVVLERVIDFLVPKHTAIGGRDVHQFNEVGVAHKVIRQDRSALQTREDPSVVVLRVCDVQLSDGDGVDFVRGFWHSALHRLFIVVRENGGHCVFLC